MTYTYTRSETNEMPHTQPQCCPTCRKALLLTILNSAVILAAIVSAVVFHLVIGINNTPSTQQTSCDQPRADQQKQSRPTSIERPIDGEPTAADPTFQSEEDIVNVIASDYSLSTTNTVTVTSTSSPDARTYTPEVIPDNSDPENEDSQSQESSFEEELETGLTTKRNDRPRKSKSKKKSSRGRDHETVESEDSAEDSENGEVSDKKKNRKQGKNNQKKKDKGNKGNNIPVFQFTECTEYFLDFELSEDHDQKDHSEDNSVITHITVHLDDASQERIKVRCCQLVLT